MKLRKLYFYNFIFGIIVPLFLFVFLVLPYQYYAIKKTIIDSSNQVNLVISQSIDEKLDRVKKRIYFYGRKIEKNRFNQVETSNLIRFLVEENPQVLSAQFSDEKGFVRYIYPYDRSFINFDVSGYEFFQAIKSGSKEFWGGSFISPQLKRPATSFSIAVKGGIFTVYLDISYFISDISQFKSDKNNFAAIVDQKGTFIGHSDSYYVENAFVEENYVNFKENYSKGIYQTEAKVNDMDMLCFVSFSQATGWATILYYSLWEINKSLLIALIPFMVMIVVILATILSIYYVLKLISGSLNNLVASTDQIAAGDYFVKSFPVSSIDEINNLSERFHLMGNAILNDIAKRENTERRLRENENFLQTLINATPIGICVISKERKIMRINKAIETLTGYSEEEVVGSFTQFLYPSIEEHERVGREISAGVFQHGIWSLDTQWIRKDGVIIDILMWCGATENHGLGEQWIVTAMDISEKKASERILRESEERFRMLITLSPNPTIVIQANDPEFNIVLINNKFSDLLGYSSKDVWNFKTFVEHVFPDEDYRSYISGVWKAIFRDMLSNGNRYVDPLETELMTRDNHRLNVLCHIGIMDEWGLIIFQDITQRKMVETQLKLMNDTLEANVEERTRELVAANENLKNTMSELREAHDQLVLSEKMAALGQLVAGIAHELNTPLGAIISANGMGENFALKFINELSEFAGLLDDSSKGLLEDLVLDIQNGSFIADPAFLRERRKHLIALSERENLEAGDSIIEDLVDFGYTGDDEHFKKMCAIENFRQIVSKVYHFSIVIRSLRIIKTAAGKAAGVVGALKTYSHHDSSGEMTETGIVDDIEMILTLYYNQLKEGIEVIKHYNAKPAVKCYPEKLHQVWVNIINNALHAMNHSGSLEIEVDELDNEALVSITDSGTGIPVEIQDKIFTPFFTTKVAGEGSGLGLDICKRIVEQIGGRISFVSVPGRTTFSIRLKM